jgi:DNA-binding MarR family transcriptional regulator
MSTSRAKAFPRVTAADAVRLTAARRNNIRQLLLRASRVLNVEIVAELTRRGYAIRSTHTALLSNLDAGGNKLSVVAARAGMSKQAMGRLADELGTLGYLLSTDDAEDKRSRILRFTTKGWDLMIESFNTLEAIERRYANRIGVERLESLRTILQDLLSSSQSDSQPPHS